MVAGPTAPSISIFSLPTAYPGARSGGRQSGFDGGVESAAAGQRSFGGDRRGSVTETGGARTRVVGSRR
uniref:Uncharacterized protein n=1 Tax=Arundo donax TaxID=35708 RepID=A0A0A8ZAH7_ARUDO